MNWKKGKPPDDFVDFAIEYGEPGGPGPTGRTMSAQGGNDIF
jgi:hypothetical protein